MDAAGTTWVGPRWSSTSRRSGMTPAKRLRQPAYRGVRTRPGARGPGGRGWLRRRATRCWSTSSGRTLKISNLDKVLYPRTGTTKGEVLNYYARVAPVLLPHLARPGGDPDPLAARHRRTCSSSRRTLPAGAPSLGAHGRRCRRPGSRGGRTATRLVFPVIDDLADLTCWPTWPPSSCTCTSGRSAATAGRSNPDRLVIDLDPGEPAGLHECCQVALLVRDKLAERGLAARR